MTATVSSTEVLSALKILSDFDVKGAIAAFESKSVQNEIIDGVIAVDDVLQVIGLFIPPVAVIANDIKIAIEVEKIAAPIVQLLLQLPVFKTPSGNFTAFNQPFTSTITQG